MSKTRHIKLELAIGSSGKSSIPGRTVQTLSYVLQALSAVHNEEGPFM